PQKPQQLYHAVQQLNGMATLSRTHRLVLRKAGKAIDRLNVIQAEQEAMIQSQKTQIENLQIEKPRKRVPVDLNSRFANIRIIQKAQDEAAALETKEGTELGN